MSTRKAFLAALTGRQHAGPEVPFPDQLAATAADAFGADAASLTLLQPFLRLPVGASAGADRAEQVQASFGGGPCVGTGHLEGDVPLDEGDVLLGWPAYHHALRRHTPFRSVLSVPLVRPGGTPLGALDLHAVRAEWGATVPDPGTRAELAALVSTLLAASVRDGRPAPTGSQEWTRRRRQSWVAVGMVCQTADVSEPDALALLRAHAFSTDRLLDDVADDLVSGRLAPGALLSR